MEKAQYKTRQMTEILTFLESVQGIHVTVSDISDYFKRRGVAVGTTTIYRHLEKLVDDGIVAKYIVDGTSSACFEYIGNEHADNSICYHCKCEKCGKLIHLQCKEVEALRQHIMGHHGFKINPHRIVFYGVCSDCRK